MSSNRASANSSAGALVAYHATFPVRCRRRPTTGSDARLRPILGGAPIHHPRAPERPIAHQAVDPGAHRRAGAYLSDGRKLARSARDQSEHLIQGDGSRIRDSVATRPLDGGEGHAEAFKFNGERRLVHASLEARARFDRKPGLCSVTHVPPKRSWILSYA